MKIVKNDGTKFGFKLKNGTLTGALGNLQKRKVDVALTAFFIKDYETRAAEFTFPLYSDELCVVVLKSPRIPPELLPLIIFDDLLWLSLFIVGIFIYTFWCLLRWFNNIIKRPSNPAKRVKFNIENYHLSTYLARQSSLCQYAQIFVDLLMLMVQAPMRRFPKMQSERVFICSICLLSIVIVSMYQSGMATVFFKPFYFKDINTLEGLDKSGIEIQVKYLGYMSDVFPNDSSSVYHHMKKKMKFTETTKSVSYFKDPFSLLI